MSSAYDYITATMATTPARLPFAVKAVESILPQVDKCEVYVNAIGVPISTHRSLPTGAHWRYAPAGDLGDNGKFYDPPTYGWHFTIDDDLIYPADYVTRTIEKADAYGRGCIVAWHGSRVKPPVASYYADRATFHVRGNVLEDATVNVPGTGVMCYRAGAVDLAWFEWKYPVPFMADLWVAREAQKQRVPIIVPAHKDRWIGYQDIPGELTICNWFKGHDQIQTWVANRYIRDCYAVV